MVMKIVKFNENNNEYGAREVVIDALKPFNEILKLEIEEKYVHTLSIKIWNSLDNETCSDFINLFNTLNKFGLIWYIDNINLMIELDYFNNDEVQKYIDAKKYNL